MTLRIALVLLCCSIGAVAADDHTLTRMLYTSCRATFQDYDRDPAKWMDSAPDVNGTFCDEFITGFWLGLAEGGGRYFVRKNNAEQLQLMRSFVNYVTAHPLEMDSPHISKVLIKAWLADGMIVKR